MANERAERKGWRTILGGASNDATQPPQPKQADAEDYIGAILAAQRRVKATWDAHMSAIEDYEAAQRRLGDYLDDTGISRTVDAIKTGE